MKKILNINKKFKNNKGSITSFTLLSMLFFLVVVIAIYASVNTKIQKQGKETKSVQDNYKQENIDDIYEKNIYQKKELLVTQINNGNIKIGSYVRYSPETVDENDVLELLEELKQYSGSSNNTISTLKQEKDLKWRILDVKNGEVRLISDEPTLSTIDINSYNGYNNAVKLIDDICKKLYSHTKFTSKVQNLKIEDIEEKISEKNLKKFNSDYDNTFYTVKNYYPSIMKKEKKQIIDGSEGKELERSEQQDFEQQQEIKCAEELQIKITYWNKDIVEEDFKNPQYYDLFMKKNSKNYTTYWLSSRCINYYAGRAYFDIYKIETSNVGSRSLYHSENAEGSFCYSFRPVITLKHNIELNVNGEEDGSTAEKAYSIK